MSIRSIVAVTAFALLAFAGCGDDDSEIDARVDAVRAAVDAGDRAGAEKALDELSFVTSAAAGAGQLNDAERDEIRALIESSRLLLDEVVPTTAAPTTTTSTTSTTTEPKNDDKGKKKGDEERDDDD